MINKEKIIFIVDDDEHWALKLEQMLHDLGFTNTFWFSTGSKCLDAMDEQPSIIFLDFQMEGLDGLQVLQRVKLISPETEVVFCTSFEDISVAIKAIRFGSHDFLLKINASHKELKKLTKTLQIS